MAPRFSVILGWGDVGRRIIAQLISRSIKQAHPISDSSLLACTRSAQAREKNALLGVQSIELDIDKVHTLPPEIEASDLYYLIPPPKQGSVDTRSRRVIELLSKQGLKPRKLLLISTTGVYGDCPACGKNRKRNFSKNRGQIKKLTLFVFTYTQNGLKLLRIYTNMLLSKVILFKFQQNRAENHVSGRP